MEYSAIILSMKYNPAFNPDYIKMHPYRCISADEYRMGQNYHILRENGLDDHLLLLTLAGGGVANSIKLEPFSMYLFNPNERHDYATDPNFGTWHFLWAHIHAPASWKTLLDWKTISLMSASQAERRRIIALFRDAVVNSSTGSAYDESLAMNLMENILLRIARFRKGTFDSSFNFDVRTYILEHLSEPLDIPTLAAQFQLSASRFAHRFRSMFGTSPQSYVENCRLEMARKMLLTTTLSIKEIAFTCGFNDPLYFSKRFTRINGTSPSQWRQSP